MRFVAVLFLAPLAVLATMAGWAAAEAGTAPPSCAAGPKTVGDTTYGTPCDDVIVAPADVATVRGGGGDDVMVAAPLAADEACPAPCHLGVGSQTFEGGAGDDIVFGERGNDTLRGGPGNDQLFGGIGDDLLQGGPGNDRLSGGFGADSIDGEADNDYVRGDGTIDRIFDTGGGFDTLSYSSGITPGFGGGGPPYANFPAAEGERGVRLDLSATGENGNNGIAALGGGVDEVEGQSFEAIIGTPFSDYIIGSENGEAIFGGGGADVILGGGGNDTLSGGADGDYLSGGSGTNSLDGGPGENHCENALGAVTNCGPNALQVAPRDTGKVSVGQTNAGGYAQLYLVGSSARDEVRATPVPGAVVFTLTAGSFDVGPADAGGCVFNSVVEAVCPLSAPLDSLTIAGMGGADVIAAESFPDTVGLVLTGGEDGDAVAGGDASEDTLVDGPGAGGDTLSGGGGDDALLHNGGADRLFGGDGNDLFLSASVCDGESLSGGAGRDNASWARFKEEGAEAGVGANLEAGLAGRAGAGSIPDCGGAPTDSLAEIEDLEGSSGADVFYGDSGPNQLLGRPGSDTYFAQAGDDSILANSGDADAVINCGPGTDSALIDHPQYGDPEPIECESVAEADPNNFRTITLLPKPPLAKPPPPDRKAPRTRLLAHPAARVFTRRAWRRVAFHFGSNETGSQFLCKLDGKPYRPCLSPRVYRVRAGRAGGRAARHAVRIVAVDLAGNRDRTPVLFKFQVIRRAAR